MLQRLLKSTDEILNEIQTGLKVNNGNAEKPSIIDSEAKRGRVWIFGRNCVNVLDKVEEDLTLTRDTLAKWSDREKYRGQEKPRWTLNDEKKYRKRITELQASITNVQREFGNQQVKLQRLQKFISDEQETQRALRDAHYDRNIRCFTYITIIFAPLSFAEGFYSMGGVPDHTLVTSLVKFCFAALGATGVGILLAIKTLPVLKTWTSGFESQDWSRRVSSLLFTSAQNFEKGMTGWRNKTSPAQRAMSFATCLIFAIVFGTFWPISFLLPQARDMYRRSSKSIWSWLHPILNSLYARIISKLIVISSARTRTSV